MRCGVRPFCQICQDVLALTVGDDDTDTGLRDLAGGSVFRMHTPTSEGALLGLYVFREVTARSHFAYQFGGRVITLIPSISIIRWILLRL